MKNRFKIDLIIEGVEIDCPKCGETAILTDRGIYCPNCANN